MASTSHRSRTLSKWGLVLCCLFFLLLLSPNQIQAQLTSQFTLSAGEMYNNNIFLDSSKEWDFITLIRPAFSLQYRFPSQLSPTLTLNIAPIGQIYARHSDQNTFGFGQGGGGSMAYTYPYSPRLTFNFSDVLSAQGDTRVLFQGPGGVGQLLPGGTPSPGVPIPPSGYQQGSNAFSVGQTINNSFWAYGQYLYSPAITITGGYQNYYTSFVSAGGFEVNNEFGIRGSYAWGQNHNPHAGVRVSIFKDRTGDSNVVYDFDIGDSYFSSQQIQLTPTLTLSLSTGLSINAGKRGPGIGNNSYAQLIKLWERAQLSAGVQSSLTPTYGFGRISQTTTVSGNFYILLSERLTGSAYLNYALFSGSGSPRTFVAGAALQYLVTPWLTSSLRYGHLITNCCDTQGNQKKFTTGPRVHSDSVLLGFSAYFDVWPRFGLGTVLPQPSLFPGVPPQVGQPSPAYQPAPIPGP